MPSLRIIKRNAEIRKRYFELKENPLPEGSKWDDNLLADKIAEETLLSKQTIKNILFTNKYKEN